MPDRRVIARPPSLRACATPPPPRLPGRRLEDDTVLHWSVLEAGEWEELRECPDCGALWLSAWPEELEANPILCRPLPDRRPPPARRRPQRDPAPLLPGPPRGAPRRAQRGEAPCKKVDCERRRLRDTAYCLEHHIAQRFGRQLLDGSQIAWAAARASPFRLGQTKKKKARKKRLASSAPFLRISSRRRPTLPQGFPCSTIGPGGLNFRVRDGIGCEPLRYSRRKIFGVLRFELRLESELELIYRASTSTFCKRSILTNLPTAPVVENKGEIMVVKPHDRLVLVSSTHCRASTPGLSTS